jgi:hypothetical protein
MAAVADYLVYSQQRPNDAWLTAYQQLLTAMLSQQQQQQQQQQPVERDAFGRTTTTTSSSSSSSGSSGGAVLYWSGADLARALRALQVWQVKPAADLLTSALAASQVQLQGMGLEGLGALLLGLAGLGAKPSPAWMAEWCSTVQQQLSKLPSSTTNSSSGASAARQAQAVASLAPAVARVNHRPPEEWWSTYHQALTGQLPAASAVDLANVCQALDSCGQVPPGSWFTAVKARLGQLSAGRDRDLAVAWLTKLEVRAGGRR